MLRKVKTFAIIESDEIIQQLPADATLKAIDIVIKGTATFNTTLIEKHAESLLKQVQLRANGNTIKSMRGYSLYALDNCLQGEQLYKHVPLTDTAIGKEFALMYRLWMQDPTGLFPNRTLFDTRPFKDNLDIKVSTLTKAEMYTVPGTVTLTNMTCEIWYDDAEISSRPQVGGALFIQEYELDYPVTAISETYDWKEKGRTIRSFLMTVLDNIGEYNDDVIDKIVLRLNGKVDYIREVDWEMLKYHTVLNTGLNKDEISVGTAFWDFDPKRQGLPLLTPEYSQIEFIPYRETGATAPVITVVRRSIASIQALLGR